MTLFHAMAKLKQNRANKNIIMSPILLQKWAHQIVK